MKNHPNFALALSAGIIAANLLAATVVHAEDTKKKNQPQNTPQPQHTTVAHTVTPPTHATPPPQPVKSPNNNELREHATAQPPKTSVQATPQAKMATANANAVKTESTQGSAQHVEHAVNAESARVGVAIAQPGKPETTTTIHEVPLHERELKSETQVTSFVDEISLLRQAYAELRRADHDYNGHRADAMRETEAAAGLLHSSVGGGDGAGRESQLASDGQLSAARSALQEARSLAQARRQSGAAAHMLAAIMEINDALAMK